MKIKYFEERINKLVKDSVLPQDFELKEVSLDPHANLIRAYGYSDNGKRVYMWNKKGMGFRNSPFEEYVLIHRDDDIHEIVKGEILTEYNSININDNC